MTAHLDPSDTERALREALSTRARQVHPSPRLEAILREASLPERSDGRRRSLALVGVAAAAAVVVGAVWLARPAPEGAPAVPAGTASATPTPPGASPPAAVPTVAVAHYVVGTNAGPGSRPCMVRTFTTASWTTDASSSSDKVLATARSMVAASRLWDGVTVEDAEVSSSRITLDLAGAGTTVDAPRARLALRTLAWTAQAVLGEGDVPVALRTRDGGGLFGHEVPATLTRAGTPAESVCDIWIDHPAPDASVPPGSLVARGQAVAAAGVQWELRRGTTIVRRGVSPTSATAPARGTFLVDLGRLEPGTWTLRAFTTSDEDGERVVAERLSTFVVE